MGRDRKSCEVSWHSTSSRRSRGSTLARSEIWNWRLERTSEIPYAQLVRRLISTRRAQSGSLCATRRRRRREEASSPEPKKTRGEKRSSLHARRKRSQRGGECDGLSARAFSIAAVVCVQTSVVLFWQCTKVRKNPRGLLYPMYMPQPVGK